GTGQKPQVLARRRRHRGRRGHRRPRHRPRHPAHGREVLTVPGDLLWRRYASPGDLSVIEAVPLQDRGLPQTSYALLTRAATLWPERTAGTGAGEPARSAETTL